MLKYKLKVERMVDNQPQFDKLNSEISGKNKVLDVLSKDYQYLK